MSNPIVTMTMESGDVMTFELYPDIAVLDAELVKTVPPAITAATGMDVFTHAVEAFVCTEANHFTDACAEKAMKLVRSYLLRCYKNPEDMEQAARQLVDEANKAGGKDNISVVLVRI